MNGQCLEHVQRFWFASWNARVFPKTAVVSNFRVYPCPQYKTLEDRTRPDNCLWSSHAYSVTGQNWRKTQKMFQLSWNIPGLDSGSGSGSLRLVATSYTCSTSATKKKPEMRWCFLKRDLQLRYTCIHPGAVKLVLWRSWIHLSYMHPVTSDRQFHCARPVIHSCSTIKASL